MICRMTPGELASLEGCIPLLASHGLYESCLAIHAALAVIEDQAAELALLRVIGLDYGNDPLCDEATCLKCDTWRKWFAKYGSRT